MARESKRSTIIPMILKGTVTIEWRNPNSCIWNEKTLTGKLRTM